jgi:hypothetical protein
VLASGKPGAAQLELGGHAGGDGIGGHGGAR